MTPTVVVGKRVDRKGLPPGLMVFAAAVVLVVYAVLRFLDGDTTIGVVLVVGAGVVALVGGMVAGDAKRTSEIVSACPVCGAERQRKFMALKDEPDPPSACGACLAYLRVNLGSLEVKEEAVEATGFYAVQPAQYQSVVPRNGDAERSFKFEMPTMCAVCGEPDASSLRDIVDGNPAAGAGGGLTGNLAYRANSNPVPGTATSPGKELDAALSNLKIPVCAKHSPTAFHGEVVSYWDGTLMFTSYRYYKGFCMLNGIASPQQA